MSEETSHAELIDARIEDLDDWRGETLSRIRSLIKEADPEVVEEVKWRKPSNSMLGVPVWSHDGIICTGEPYKDKVKLTFAKGASLSDPSGRNVPENGADPDVIAVDASSSRIVPEKLSPPPPTSVISSTRVPPGEIRNTSRSWSRV